MARNALSLFWWRRWVGLTALGEIGGILVVRCLHIGGGGDCLGLGRAATIHENTTSASAATCAC
jgi:hypothetical protein